MITIDSPNNHITNGYDWGLDLYFYLTIVNPTNFGIALDAMSFDIYFQGTYIGNATVNNVNLAVGTNHVIGNSTYVNPNNTELESLFFSTYLNGNNSDVVLVGNAGNIPLMVAAASSLNINLVFPGQHERMPQPKYFSYTDCFW